MIARCFRCDKVAIKVRSYNEDFEWAWTVEILHEDNSKCICKASYQDWAQGPSIDNPYYALSNKFSNLIAAIAESRSTGE